MRQLAFILMVLTLVGAVNSVNPGFKMRLTKKGVDYVNDIAQTAIDTQLQKLDLPDQSGVKGSMSWSLTNIQRTGLSLPKSSMTFDPVKGGLTWALSNFGLDLSTNWWLSYKKGWLKGSDSGSVDVGVKRFSVSITAGLEADSQRRPSISIKSCSSSIGSIQTKFHGSIAFVLNIFKGIVEKKVKQLINDQVCELLTYLIDQAVQENLREKEVTFEIDDTLVVDFRLLAPVTFAPDYMESQHKGEVYWREEQREILPPPAPISEWTDNSRMLYLWLTEYSANTLLYATFRRGHFKYHLTHMDLFPDYSSLLDTTCDPGPCIGSLIPQIGQAYRDSNVEIRIMATTAPQVKITSDGLTLNLIGDLDLYADTADGTAVYLLTLSLSLTLTVNVSVRNQRLIGNITNHNFSVSLVKSEVGTIDVDQIQQMLEVTVNQFVITYLNELGSEGLEIPLVSEVLFQNSVLTLSNGVVVIGTDVIYHHG
ncbi:unnamed protein product [Lymnaea stagnalis]|uniref:Uncharacterized protein n=1 Tax=Lymnaea stagnalis TaxID=6523 RepID=A0AAV2I1Z4_LYMST